ncbi:MAG: 30S ribosomal protein S8 [Candidatus Omnitrophica bacterium]|nr:30S ribosomal protein S8 [Candidatus Omnitrophota bacterium]
MRTDLIGDALTKIRNAIMAKKEAVDIPASGLLRKIAEILKRETYIEDFKYIEDRRQGILRIYLRYKGNKPVLTNLKRISRPGQRIYVNKEDIPLVLRGKGLAIISTSQGILTDRQARELGIGGEVIAYVW